MSYRTLKRVYAILAGAAVLTFFGHGAWAAFENSDKFRGLLSDSVNHVLGLSSTINDGWVSASVRSIGWLDISVSVMFIVLAVGVLQAHGALARFATSRIAFVLYGWATFWAFMTAGSRVTAAGAFYPAVWDVVERGANFLVPAALFYLTYILRRPAQLIQHEEAPAETELGLAPLR